MNSQSYCLLAFSKSNFRKCSSPSLLQRGVVIKAPLEKSQKNQFGNISSDMEQLNLKSILKKYFTFAKM